MKNLIQISSLILIIFLINSCDYCTTPPAIISIETNNITGNSVTLDGILATTCDETNNGTIWIIWDTIADRSYKSKYEVIDNKRTVNFTYTITGLKENTTYFGWVDVYYHLRPLIGKSHLAGSDIFVVQGDIFTFKTLSNNRK